MSRELPRVFLLRDCMPHGFVDYSKLDASYRKNVGSVYEVPKSTRSANQNITALLKLLVLHDSSSIVRRLLKALTCFLAVFLFHALHEIRELAF